MPYVPPGQPISSTIPKSLLLTDQTPSAENFKRSAHEVDYAKEPHQSDGLDKNNSQEVVEKNVSSSSSSSLQPASEDYTDVSSTPKPPLIDSFQSETDPEMSSSSSSSSSATDLGLSSTLQNLSMLEPSAIPHEEEDVSRRSSTTSSLPALDPHSASSTSLASLESTVIASPATMADGARSPEVVLGGTDEKENGITRYREGLYAYTVSHLHQFQ